MPKDEHLYAVRIIHRPFRFPELHSRVEEPFLIATCEDFTRSEVKCVEFTFVKHV